MTKYTAPSDFDYYDASDGYQPPRGPRTCVDCRRVFTAYGAELDDPQFVCRACLGRRIDAVLERATAVAREVVGRK